MLPLARQAQLETVMIMSSMAQRCLSRAQDMLIGSSFWPRQMLMLVTKGCLDLLLMQIRLGFHLERRNPIWGKDVLIPEH